MTPEIKAAVERADERAWAEFTRDTTDANDTSLFLIALADEPEVVNYLLTESQLKDRWHVQQLLKALAEIVR